MFNFKTNFLLVSIISVQISFCMSNQPPLKKQKTEEISLKEKKLDEKLDNLPLEDIKSLEEAKKFEGCLVACTAYFFRENSFEYKTTQGLFNGVKYAFISKCLHTCTSCRHGGYSINFFCNSSDMNEKLNFVLCDQKFNMEKAFFKARLLTLEEIKRILFLIKIQEYQFGEKDFLLTKTEILNLRNLLPQERRKYLRKYLYNTLPNIRMVLMGAFKDKNSILNTLHKDICMIIIKFVIEEEVENYKDDSLLLEL